MISYKDTQEAARELRKHLSQYGGWPRTLFVDGAFYGLRLMEIELKKLQDEKNKTLRRLQRSGSTNSYLKSIVTAHRQLKMGQSHHAASTLVTVINRAKKENKIQEEL